MAALRQVALGFTEGSQATMSPAVRGGKGAALAEMAGLDLPIPPGFTIATGVCRAFMEHGRLPKRLGNQLNWKLAELEQATGRTFGSSHQPLLVSVRSGAPVSMPGMMDSILNVGLMPDSRQALIAMGGDQFADDIYRRFTTQFGPLAGDDLGGLSLTPREQLLIATEAVLRSWNSDRARTYRQTQGIDDAQGTAVTVQAMVFGNLNTQSYTGVVFSRNPANGSPGLYGEFLPQAQGEDIVSGKSTPQDIRDLQALNPEVYAELESCVAQLTHHYGAIVDVEFTVESGKLFILQCRKATRSTQAAAHFAVHRQWDGRWNHQQAIASLSAAEALQLEGKRFDTAADKPEPIAQGLAASPGIAVGAVVFSSEEAVELAAIGESVVLVRPDTSPEDLKGMLAAEAVITYTGGATCHAAVVARGLKKPAITSAAFSRLLEEGEVVSVDGSTGEIFCGALPLVTAERTKEISLFLKWCHRYAHPEPRLGFESAHRQLSANRDLSNFYLADAMAAAAAGSSLEVAAIELRSRVHQEIAESFAMYLALAVGRELRHVWRYPSYCGAGREACERLRAQFGIDPFNAAQTMRNVHQRLQQVDVSQQLAFAQTATEMFAQPGWGHAYGGKKWATIAETLAGFLSGELTHSVFADRVFDLRHNSGVLFNKHEMYSSSFERVLHSQLEAKKQAAGVTDLCLCLLGVTAQPQLSRVIRFSAEVADLYDQGLKLKLW